MRQADSEGVMPSLTALHEVRGEVPMRATARVTVRVVTWVTVMPERMLGWE